MEFVLLTDLVTSPYHQTVWSGVSGWCREAGVNLVTLVTGRPGSGSPWERAPEPLRRFLEGRRADGVITMTATLANTLGQPALGTVAQLIEGFPVISLGLELASAPWVKVDCAAGMAGLLDHLYGHGYRRFAYAGGPLNNPDAWERRQVLDHFLASRGLEARPERLLDGRFSSNWGMEAVDRLVPGSLPDFDVLVCANDDIALGAREALALRGLQVPGDVAVTGFDDVHSSGPAGLTTVRQPLVELGRRSAALLAERIVSGTVEPATGMQAVVVVRETCGCLPAVVQTTGKSGMADRIELVTELSACGLPAVPASELAELFSSVCRTRDLSAWVLGLRRLFSDLARDDVSPGLIHEPLTVLRQRSDDEFARVAIDRARILVSEVVHTRAVHQEGRQLVLRDQLGALNERLVSAQSLSDHRAAWAGVLPRLGMRNYRVTLDSGASTAEGAKPPPGSRSTVAGLLFDRGSPVGVFEAETGGDREVLAVFDSVVERMGRGLESLHRIQALEDQVSLRTEELKAALTALERNNQQLKELALRDELTGLYNRRGFLTLAEHQWKAHPRRGKPMVLFYGDLDGLKKINDTRGHDAGDEAIRTAARVLIRSFRQADVVARLGGDEFAVLAPSCTPADAVRLSQRVTRTLERDTGGYGVSLGWAVVDPKSNLSLAEAMKAADEHLYAEKLARRSERSS